MTAPAARLMMATRSFAIQSRKSAMVWNVQSGICNRASIASACTLSEDFHVGSVVATVLLTAFTKFSALSSRAIRLSEKPATPVATSFLRASSHCDKNSCPHLERRRFIFQPQSTALRKYASSSVCKDTSLSTPSDFFLICVSR